MRLSSMQLGLSINIDSSIAEEYINAIHDAFTQSAQDIPKHLGDALLDIETQLHEYASNIGVKL